ncbi:hypothetical protein [Mucilaginibacter lacusdianchii]|uniref:hypothetical protein n=1 Tax=Mucilaginibacter lacusdianchii TaxID=2684211 RepID=UPI00131C0D21|nr:hypothetical protein [Mucilaginibacter sp. JXJ CY 39]
MKRTFIPKAAMPYFIIGLLLITFIPIVNRYLPMPDFARGFLIGLSLALQVIALVIIDRHKRKQACVKS